MENSLASVCILLIHIYNLQIGALPVVAMSLFPVLVFGSNKRCIFKFYKNDRLLFLKTAMYDFSWPVLYHMTHLTLFWLPATVCDVQWLLARYECPYLGPFNEILGLSTSLSKSEP